VSESEFQVVRIAGFAAAGTLALSLQRMRPHDPRITTRWVNIALWLINAAAVSVACAACACTAAQWATTAQVGLFNEVAAPAWASVLLSVLALDFVSYGWHRANHRLPLLWRFHQVHHSDSSFTVSTAMRFHPGELLLSLPIRLSTVLFLGVPVVAVILFEVCFAFANLFEHGNIGLSLRFERWLSGLFVTPALHRLHHARRRPELDSNFGTISTLWDRFMGTYRRSSSDARFETGLPSGIAVVTLAEALLLPLSRDSEG
jgi:sterol desaturase/sphingolipid hydroxylase (fatty acid hydroxylase superfamily)